MFNGRLGTFRWWSSLRSPVAVMYPLGEGISDEVNI